MDRGQGDNQQLAAGRQMGGVRVRKVKGKFTLRGATATVTHSSQAEEGLRGAFIFFFFLGSLRFVSFFNFKAGSKKVLKQDF